ncbi:MAG: aminopeptidase P family protein, partial [Anaerolineae bacterium]|nr:aminopeptidase P family protein [Anaerolineae bacterium]
MGERLRRALAEAEAEGLDALALVPGPNLYYLTGMAFFLSERPIVALVPVDATPAVVLPDLESAKATSKGLSTFSYTDEDGYALAFHQACASLELANARVGIEALKMRVLEAGILERYCPGVELVAVDDLFAGQRMVKGSDELDQMRRAVRVAERAFVSWVATVRPGMQEREAAARLISALLSSGADGLAFDPIVAAGPRGALPHATPSERPFQRGDWIVVDWGARVGGYCSDLTRMVVIGEPDGELAQVHRIVVAANAAGREAIRPGCEARDVDTAARTVIEAEGYGPQFFHRTGHGLGLEEHEPPYIVAGNG